MTDVLTLLAELGDNSEAIACSLKAKGILGDIGEGSSCPIARYLRSNGVDCVLIDYENVVLGGGDYDNDVPVPDVIAEFIGRFDCGQFPDLIEPSDDDLNQEDA